MRISYFFITLFLLLFTTITFAKNVAITMDNPNCDQTPLLAPEIRDKKILSILKKNNLKIVLFAQGAQVDNPQGMALLKRWNNAGHLIGNHTYSHLSINNISDKQYEQDTLKNEALLKSYSNFKKIFRFPYLKEGDTLAKRDEFRKFLHDHGYQNGSVTIDASDWYISDRLEKRLSQNPNADMTPYRDYYLQHIWNRAQYYDGLAQEILGRSPDHTLLVHHNLLNAIFLGDVIQMFKDKGWKVINADQAFQDPVFKMMPNTLPAGESLIWALAKQTGRYDDKLRYPGEDESYEKEAMDRLGL
ncbi:MAG: polysaccharide deacetylase family protein [Gammaproteobacteria bacterium]|nr:polysaccharide deacetylase family protein [Gammaproteobacteria bacterium]